MIWLALLALLLDGPSEEALGDRIVALARSKLGEKVGDGQCSDLVYETLRAAGADHHYRDHPVESLEEARPGDVLDFRKAAFKGRAPGGRGRQTYWHKFESHAALVASVRKRGDVLYLTILHQNYGRATSEPTRREVVSELTLRMADLTEGEIKAFRPEPRDRD